MKCDVKRDYVPNCTVLQFNCLWNTVAMFSGDKPSAWRNNNLSMSLLHACQSKTGSKPLLATLMQQINSAERKIEGFLECRCFKEFIVLLL